MSSSKVCPNCATENTSDSRFCGRCGTPLGAVPATGTPAPVSASSTGAGRSPAPPTALVGLEPADSKLKTMMMRSGEGSSGDHAVPPETAKPTSREPQHTMLGLAMAPPAPAGMLDKEEPTARNRLHEPLASPTPPATGAAASTRQAARTMLGMVSPSFGPTPSAPTSSPAGAVQAGPAQFISGVPAPAAFGPPGSSTPGPASSVPASLVSASVGPASVGPASVGAGSASASQKGSAAKKLGPSNRTMLGVVVPGVEGLLSEGPVSSAQAPEPIADPVDLSVAGIPSPRKRGSGCLLAVLASAILVAIGALGAFVYFRFVARGPAVMAAIAQTPAGEVVRIQLPDAVPGTVVRYAGTERPVEQGVAELPLAADTLRLGDNVLNVEIVAGNTTTAVPITLTVEYRVRAELSGLEAIPPSISVVIEALPGSSVRVGGAAVALDGAGHGRVEVPVASLTTATDGSLSHVAEYVVTTPAGEAATGTLTTRIPVAPLELTQPLDGAVTDRTSVWVAGRTAAPSVGQAARIAIEGHETPVGGDGSFRVEVPLPPPGPDGRTSLHLVARRPGSAPRAVTVTVRRVPDVRRAASEVAVDRRLDYGQLAEAPEAARGRVLALEGQVYNADVQDGHGVLQMLVRGCSRTDRCPVWVNYAPAEPVQPGAVVRVVGVGSGTQQFRAESGETRTVPRVDATYVVPAP